ncbi:acyl-CoA synthetase [Variovorax sp. WS11]|uniref:AMP-binding protein n=1 Tax=Variovorax sp. WS11 TaxID=1105204 RepID=UPI000D0D0F92|nr:AMP-binding protein [Variovorax sp. WS11]NDZ17764.1 AMP-binding protein [Variovorax sp. WS11]PSL80194.1 acyl-CoA synthetase [Variovorax sp. WS11]
MGALFDEGLAKNAANFQALSPISFLKRTAEIYPEYGAVVYRERRMSYRELLRRCEDFAGFLDMRGLRKGDVVAAMLPNIPEMLELSHAGISAGRVLLTINVRLDAAVIRFQLEHAEAKVLVYDREYAATIAGALAGMKSPPLALEVVDTGVAYTTVPLGHMGYEEAVSHGHGHGQLVGPEDEWDAIAVSYTSGTTGNPKGVVTHHRGAYLNAMANTVAWSMGAHPAYLWVLPMFHCNGWCFPWTITLLAGTHLCLRKVEDQAILDIANAHHATHFCAAPVVLSMLARRPADGKGFDTPVRILTAGAAPAASVIEGVEALNAHVTQVYGLTETYASTAVSAWKTSWNDGAYGNRYELKARAGVRFPACEALDVVDSGYQSVPWDGETIGQVVVRGNTVMRGYLKNEDATRQAFAGGWFNTGDLAVRHPDGYISIRDRSKDMINSGGEKMSSLEIEQALYTHTAIFEAVVVAAPDLKWGEVPWAFVSLKPGFEMSEEDVVAHCRARLARFKVPKRVIFGAIEHTATGKVQKFRLREFAKTTAATDGE